MNLPESKFHLILRMCGIFCIWPGHDWRPSKSGDHCRVCRRCDLIARIPGR